MPIICVYPLYPLVVPPNRLFPRSGASCRIRNRGMEIMARILPKTIPWLMAAAIAVLPTGTLPCNCSTSGSDYGGAANVKKAAKSHDCCCCCCKKRAAAGTPNATQALPKPHSDSNQGCGCGSACVCVSSRPVPPPLPSTPPVRIQSRDYWIAAPSVTFSATDIQASVRPAWVEDSRPPCLSAPARCSTLCRWLF
jgi:hypothetical protein